MANMNFFGNLYLVADPTEDNYLATKSYADSVLAHSDNIVQLTTSVIPFTKSGQVFFLECNGECSISLDSSGYVFGTNEIVDFVFILQCKTTTITFPEWKWHNRVSPNPSSGKWFVIRLTSVDGGQTWLAKVVGEYSVPSVSGVSVTGGSVLYDGEIHSVSDLVTVTGTANGDTVTFSPATVTTEGEHTITVTVSRTGYAPYVTTCVVKLLASLTMTFTNSDSMPWNNLILEGSVSVTDLVNGVASCTYGGNTYTGTVGANGAFSINLSGANVTEGEQTFTVVVTSDNYATVSDDVDVTVEKGLMNLNVTTPDITYTKNIKLVVKYGINNIYPDSPVVYTDVPNALYESGDSGSTRYSATGTRGRANIVIPGPFSSTGWKGELIVYYDGDSRYQADSDSVRFTIKGSGNAPIS